MSDNKWTININVDSARNQLIETMRLTLQHVVLGLQAVESCPDGELHLDEVFFSWEFNEPAASTPQTREEFKSWLLGVGLRDGIESLNVFIDEIRFFAGLMKRTLSEGHRVARAGRVTAVLRDFRKEEIGRYARLGLPDKLENLFAEFGIKVPLADAILSLQKARNCLTHRRGIVGAEDRNTENGGLRVQFVVLETVHTDLSGRIHAAERDTLVLAGESVGVRWAEREKTFPIGQRVTFTAQEFQHLIYTLWDAGSLLIDEFIKYAEAHGLVDRNEKDSPVH
jgi:hypothetical protein